MKKYSFILFVVFIFFACSPKTETKPGTERKQDYFLSLRVWETIEPLMKHTKSVIVEHEWQDLISNQKELLSGFSALTNKLQNIRTHNERYSLILKYQKEAWAQTENVFKGDLSSIDNIENLLMTDKNNVMTSGVVNTLKEKPLPEYFSDMNKADKTSKNILTWGSRIIKLLQNKMLTGKEIKTEKDIKIIKAVIDRAANEGRLEELQTYLEKESSKKRVSPSVLFSLSLVYGKKGLIKEEYKTIKKLEKKVRSSPEIAFSLSLVYGRKKILKSRIDKAEADALALTQGYISITSNTQGVDVYINGERAGKTPYKSGLMPEGTYSVELRKKDFISVNKKVIVKAGKTASISGKMILKPGSIDVSSVPSGSAVYVNGIDKGLTPLQIHSITPGKYEVLIKKKGYNDKTEIVSIKPGVNRIIAAKLTALNGIIDIMDFSEGCEVYLDGTRAYPQRGSLTDITAGNHTVLIKKTGFKEKTIYVLLAPGNTSYISGKLERAAEKIQYALIKVDGRASDWNNIIPVIVDETGDNRNSPKGTDIHKIYMATDGTYLYTSIVLADGAPSRKPLYFAIGIDNTNGTSLGLLFTEYNGRWKTGFDRWTDKKKGLHKRVKDGTVRARAGIIEGKYKLKDIGIVLEKPFMINGWDDSSGGSYDSTPEIEVVWTNHYQFFTASGRIRGKSVNERTLSPKVFPYRNKDGNREIRISLMSSRKEEIGLQFLLDKLKQGSYRVREKDFDIIIFSSIIKKAEGYHGNLVSGKFVVYENSANWVSGYYNFTSNIGDKLSGFFSAKKE